MVNQVPQYQPTPIEPRRVEKIRMQCQECYRNFKCINPWDAECPQCGSGDIEVV